MEIWSDDTLQKSDSLAKTVSGEEVIFRLAKMTKDTHIVVVRCRESVRASRSRSRESSLLWNQVLEIIKE